VRGSAAVIYRRIMRQHRHHVAGRSRFIGRLAAAGGVSAV